MNGHSRACLTRSYQWELQPDYVRAYQLVPAALDPQEYGKWILMITRGTLVGAESYTGLFKMALTATLLILLLHSWNS